MNAKNTIQLSLTKSTKNRSARKKPLQNLPQHTPRVALIPAAGRARRLGPIEPPKPLLEIAGEAMIFRLLRQLKESGICRVVVVTGYHEDALIEALERFKLPGLELQRVSNPRWQRGLLESLLCARPYIQEDFALVMADHVFEEGIIPRFLSQPLKESDLLRVLGDKNPTRPLSRPVYLKTKGDRVRATGRNLKKENTVDAGLFYARPALFNLLERAAKRGGSDLCEGVQLAVEEGRAQWMNIGQSPWFDVDTPAELIRAEMALRSRLKNTTTGQIEPQLAPLNTYSFSTGQPVETEIIIERGFVNNAQTSFIPVESKNSPLYVFTDTRVDQLYGDTFLHGLEKQGYNATKIVLPEGEEAKSIHEFSRVVSEVLRGGIDERTILISLGGGVVCNVCGFVASTLYRGMGLIHVPTTVMAQCDAAISHKQAINGPVGKNAVGAYYAPTKIIIDTEVLNTLEDWRIYDGLAEVAKHALAQDADLLEYLLEYQGDVRNLDFLERVIRRNIELKCLLVSQDPKEEKEAMVLHYGHTLGHAIEVLSGFELGHGQAVSIGMMLAAKIAHLMGCCAKEVVDLHEQILTKLQLPIHIPENISKETIIKSLRYGKRYLVEGTRFALVSAPGRLHCVDGVFTIPVSDQLLAQTLQSAYKAKALAA